MNTIAMARRLLRSVIPLIALGLVLAPVRPLADCDHLQCTREANAEAKTQCMALGADDSTALFAGAQCGYGAYLSSTWELYCLFNNDTWQFVNFFSDCLESCESCGGGDGGGGGGGGGGGPDGDECTLTAGQWCPITCVSCTVEQAY